MSRNPVPSLALLAAVTAIGFCALQMVVPVLPLLATAFDDRAAQVQLVLTLYLGDRRRAARLRALVRPVRPPPGADRRLGDGPGRPPSCPPPPGAPSVCPRPR